jgi:hypothetical protein
VRWRWQLPSRAAYKGPYSVVVERESWQRGFAGRADGSACPTPTTPP